MFVGFDERRGRFFIKNRAVSPASVLSSRLLLRALEEARTFASGRLLDVGCGTKPYRQLFGATEHIGTDWPSSFHQVNVEVFASAESLPFKSGLFDTVLCTELIEHLRHPADAMSEMSRVLKPGGHLILSAPFVHEVHEQPFDFFRYTPLGLLALAEEAGLTPILLRPRGGRGTIVMDVVSRSMWRVVRAVLRRVPGGRRVGGMLAYPLLFWPQTLLAHIVATNSQKSWRADSSHGLKNPAALSLGFVLVARKNDG